MNPFEEWLQRLFAKPPENPTKKQQDNIFAEGIRNAVATIATVGLANPISYGAVDFIRSAGQQQRANLDKALKKGISSLTEDERLNLALDFGGAVGSIENQGAKIPSWLEASTQYGAKKTALREQLLDSFRKIRHPLEGQVPSRRIYHSSRGIFEAPTLDPARQGAGVGDFWQGTGAAYVAESPGVRDYYRNVLANSTKYNDVKLPSGKVIANPNLKLEELINKIDRQRVDLYKDYIVNNNRESLEKSMDLISRSRQLKNKREEWLGLKGEEYKATLPKLLTDLKKEYLDTYQKLQQSNLSKDTRAELTGRLREINYDINSAQRKLAKPGTITPEEPRVTSYSGFFYANPNELFNLNIPIAQQPAAERIIAGLNELPVGSGDRGFILPGERVGDAMIRQQRNNIAEPNLSSTNANEMIVSGQRQGGSNWSAVRPEFTSATPWQVMEALKDKGIVGNQYLDRKSLEAAVGPEGVTNPTYNYVVTDPSRLRFTDLFAAAPFGMAMQSMQQEQEKKNAAKSRKKP